MKSPCSPSVSVVRSSGRQKATESPLTCFPNSMIMTALFAGSTSLACASLRQAQGQPEHAVQPSVVPVVERVLLQPDELWPQEQQLCAKAAEGDCWICAVATGEDNAVRGTRAIQRKKSGDPIQLAAPLQLTE